MISADGYILVNGNPVRGHAVSEDGKIQFSEGPLDGVPDYTGMILPPLVDTHTHCADAGVKPKPGMTLEELVAPPNGLKHVYLRNTPRPRIIQDMKGFERDAGWNGICSFIDFREGGVDGCLMAREACPSAIVLGRPTSKEFDSEEVERILSIADGIALSSISDIDFSYAEKVAIAAHDAGKTFAIHCSERVREDLDKVLSLGPDFLVHMVEATDPDLRKCADMDIPISVCPRSNRFFGKVPPLKRMMAAGNTVGLGTDNAMLCPPDLRPEAALFNEILGKGEDCSRWTWKCLSDGSRELLYHTRGFTNHRRMERGFSVLPMNGREPESAWRENGRVFSIH